jgi:predicted nucleic-acid-binding protein
MITLDTNLIVRYLLRDEPRQADIAREFLRAHECLISCTVLLEVVWVLASKHTYHLPKAVILERLRHLMSLPMVFTEKPQVVLLALEWYEQAMEFADALHLASSVLNPVSEAFATFDKGIETKVNQLGISHQLIFLN